MARSPCRSSLERVGGNPEANHGWKLQLDFARANVLFGLASTRDLLAVVAVLASLYPVVTVVLARLVLGERLAAWQRLGGAAAIGGAALVAVG